MRSDEQNSFLFFFSETSELLAYDASKAQDVERVRLTRAAGRAGI